MSKTTSTSSIEKKNSKNEIDAATVKDDGNVQNNEFVSDSYETSINEEEIKLEMKQLKLDNNSNKNNTNTNTEGVEGKLMIKFD